MTRAQLQRSRIGRMIVFGLLVAAAAFSFNVARADSNTEELPIEMKTTGTPPVDLLYNGKAIDRDDAADLMKKGVDLSKLDPIPNDTWKPEKLPLSNEQIFNYPADGSEVLFLNGLVGNNMTRAQVEINGRPFRLIVNMDSHQAIMTAALLRSLGYPVDMPKAYRSLRVRFTKAEDLRTFMDDCTLETRFSCDRWLTEVDEKNLVLSFRDVNLEYPRVDLQQIYDGQVKMGWVDGRRAMRALIIPLILTDVRLSEDSVNLFPWEFARILGEHVVLSHPYVGAFAESTFEDFRWIGRKVAALSKDDLRAIVALGKWPDDIAALLLEKITARRNHLVRILELNREGFTEFPYSNQITTGFVKNGEATRETYPDYAARFTVGDPESPMRWSELRHYIRMEGIAQGVRAIMTKVNEKIQILDAKEGLQDHQKKVMDDILEHFKQHPNEPYVMPLRPWVEPLLGFNVNASRSLVTGTYYGSESKAQLVDNFSIGANVGAFGSIDGRTYLKNFAVGANTGYVRTYTHVRPIQSLAAVKNENWKNLFTPGFFRGTGKVLTWRQVKKNYDLFVDSFENAQQTYFKALQKYSVEHGAWEKSHAEIVNLNGGQPIHCPEPAIPASETDVKLLYSTIFGDVFPEGYELPSATAAPGTPLRPGLSDAIRSVTDLSDWTFKTKIEKFVAGLDDMRSSYSLAHEKEIADRNLWNAFVSRFPGRELRCDLEPKQPKPADVAALFKSATGKDWPSDRTPPTFSEDPNHPAELPQNLEDTLVVSTMKSFLEDLRDNEVFTITDSFIKSVSPQVTIPLTTLAGTGVVDLIGKSLYDKAAPSVGVSLTGQWAVTKRLMIVRKGDQIQVYDNKLNTRASGAALNFSAWVELAKVAAKKKKGEADTEALMLDLSPVTDSDKVVDPAYAADRKKLLHAMADLFFKNEIDTAATYSPAFELHHNMKGKTKSAKVLLWNWNTYAETHRVKVTPPVDPEGRYDAVKEARTLYSARKMNLKGKNPYGLMGQVLSKTVGVKGLLDTGDNLNPSSTFLGTSNWSQVRSEAEVTDGRDFKPTITFEDHYSGWFMGHDKLLKILNRIQSEVNDLNLGSPIFRSDMFASTTQLQSYDIRSNVILYPSGVEKLKGFIIQPSREKLLKVLMDFMDPDDYGRACKNYLQNENNIEALLKAWEEDMGPHPGTLKSNCIQGWMRKFMRHVRRRPKEREKEKYVQWLTDTMYILDKNVDVSRFLSKIGKENFFMQVKVSGFRKGDEAALNNNQETDYITDTIGTIQSPISLGAFRDLDVYSNGVKWNISDYELQGRYFGEGL